MLPSEFVHHFQVQAHGSDAMVDEDNCVFFLPHRPRSRITEPPFFLFMKGTGTGVKNYLNRYDHFCSKLSAVVNFQACYVFSILGKGRSTSRLRKFCYYLSFSCHFVMKFLSKFRHTGWCGAGADHYEPLIAHPSTFVSQEKVAVVL